MIPVTSCIILSTWSGSVPPTLHMPLACVPPGRGDRYSKSPRRSVHPPLTRALRELDGALGSIGRPDPSKRSGRTSTSSSLPDSDRSDSGSSFRCLPTTGRLALGSELRRRLRKRRRAGTTALSLSSAAPFSSSTFSRDLVAR